MFLKSVNKLFQKKISITAYLTIFYALTTFIVLAIIAIFLYEEMVDVLHQNNRQILSDEINVVYNIIENHDKENTLKHEVQDVPSMIQNSIYHYSIRVVNSANKTILETAGMTQKFANHPFFVTPAKAIKEFTYWHGPQGNKYLLMKVAVHPYPNSDEIWQIQGAMNVSFQHAWIVARKHTTEIIFFISEFIAIFLGYFVTRRGLRKLYDLTRTAKNITAKSLHQRIETQTWPTELRKLGRAFNDMLMRIENAFASLNQLSADLAHELRIPIHNMLGETELALASVSDHPQLAPVLESNIEELQRLSKIVENILFLARAEQPHLELSKQDLHLAEEIHFITEYYQPLAEDKNIKIIFTGDATITISANQIMVRRALSNLLSNALKYSHPNSQVTINIESNENSVTVKVADTGVGIAPEHLPHIFTRFYRVNTIHIEQSTGNGLGLAIVKSIMKLHQGTSEISSILGVGTTISLHFSK